ncbi:MAG: hypothetical protein AABW45_01850 [Nanoarchaeota archaeon]
MTTGSVLVPCKLCKTKVSVSDLRKNKDGVYVCNNCLNYGYSGMPALREVTQTRNPLPSKVIKIDRSDERISYVCNSCKFSFTKPLSSEDKNCPMCGKDFNVQRKQSASELLKEVNDMFGE